MNEYGEHLMSVLEKNKRRFGLSNLDAIIDDRTKEDMFYSIIFSHVQSTKVQYSVLKEVTEDWEPALVPVELREVNERYNAMLEESITFGDSFLKRFQNNKPQMEDFHRYFEGLVKIMEKYHQTPQINLGEQK